MGRPRKEKDPWADLPEEFKAKVTAAGIDDEAITREIREAALYRQALKEAKANDEDLKAQKAKARDAGAVYREGDKLCALKIAFCRAELKSRARVLPGD